MKSFYAAVALAIAYLILGDAVAFGQVEVRTVTTIHCTTVIPEGAKAEYDWYAKRGLTLTPSESGRSAAPSGNGEGTLKVTIDGVATWYEFTHGDAPVPVPTVETLRDLVRSPTEAKQVANYILAFIDEVPALKTPAEFWALFDAAFPVADNTGLLTALKARLNPVLNERKKELTKELRAIAAEIAPPVPPEPKPEPKPPVVEGKRQVILLREAGDTTPELSSLIAKLQSVGPDYEYLRSKNHIVRTYDDEQRSGGEPIPLVEKLAPLHPLPELYILDEHGNIIANLNIDPDSSDGSPATTSGQVVEFVRNHGG